MSIKDQEMVEDILKLAAQVYEGLTENEIEEIENIAKRAKRFFINREI